jgi:hypothetical protein
MLGLMATAKVSAMAPAIPVQPHHSVSLALGMGQVALTGKARLSQSSMNDPL